VAGAEISAEDDACDGSEYPGEDLYGACGAGMVFRGDDRHEDAADQPSVRTPGGEGDHGMVPTFTK
jgi:hypothetical protein